MNLDGEDLPDLGHGVYGHLRQLDGIVHGFAYVHPCSDASVRAGWAPTRTEDGWTLEQLEPVTLSPSLLCPVCGHHGFVRDGRWVPA